MATYSLSGSGTQALTAGTGALYVTITTLPADSGQGGANPADYYGIGFLRPANATAFWEPFTVCGGPQWLPLPAGTTRIGYALFGGAVVSVAEVAGASPLAFPLASLPDVAIASPADAQVLAYQASSSKWINATPTGGGGGSTTFIGCKVQTSAGVAVPTVSGVRPNFDVEIFDTDNMHDLVTNPSRITIRTAGRYLFTGGTRWGSSSVSFRGVVLYKNTSTIIHEIFTATPSSELGQECTTIDVCAVNDFYELNFFNNAGTTQTAGLGTYTKPWFSAIKLD